MNKGLGGKMFKNVSLKRKTEVNISMVSFITEQSYTSLLPSRRHFWMLQHRIWIASGNFSSVNCWKKKSQKNRQIEIWVLFNFLLLWIIISRISIHILFFIVYYTMKLFSGHFYRLSKAQHTFLSKLLSL